MWGLEYALLFGLPNNKLELFHGRTRCAFPFLTREEGEAHLEAWTETLCRWKNIAAKPAVQKGRRKWRTRIEQFELMLYPRPIELWIPLDSEVLWTLDSSFWRRDLWEQQPRGRETGWEDRQRHYDVQLNLWTLFGDWCRRCGGHRAGRVDLSLSDSTNVAPDQLYFPAQAVDCLRHDYFWGVPELIAEVLSPATRAIDRGPRKRLYRRAGVPHLWLLDPETEMVEVCELADGDYRLEATYGAGEEFQPLLFPEETVAVGRLFDTQWKRHPERFGHGEEAEPVSEWLVAPEKRLGLEYLLLIGHPERRYEIWNNAAPCVLAFGSAVEARLRLIHFLDDAASWEQTIAPRILALETDVEQAEVGRFRFTRRGRYVQLDVAVDARKYQELLPLWSDRSAWDWGEK
ncbi:MAG TPA: Uma2 family endonuclease [Gemmataceae bacterium]|jgi:Uma2 family endonuclease